MDGNLEQVREEGLVSGWCWDPEEPDRRVKLIVLVDGEPVATTVADLFRADLELAGIGDGAHAFSCLLPWESISAKSVSNIRLADEATKQLIGGSLVFRRIAMRSVEDRLREIEAKVRLLSGRLEDVTQQARYDADVVKAVLGTIGAFFTRLSETPLDTVSTTFVPSLSGLLDSTSAEREAFVFAQPSTPTVTICVSATGTLNDIYGCLSALRHAGLDAQAIIALLDDGRIDQAALLPTLIQNLHYWRLQPGQSMVELQTQVALAPQTDFVAFLASGARVSVEWLPDVLAAFERLPSCAAIGAKLVRSDGTIEASGLRPDGAGGLIDTAYGEHEMAPWCDMLAPMVALTDHAIVIRRSVFAKLHGFDVGLSDPRAALIEFCIRCWDNGHSVFYLPTCPIYWTDRSAAARYPLDPAIVGFLAHRWYRSPRPNWPNHVGSALLLDGPSPGNETSLTLLSVAMALQAVGYRVSFGVPGGLDLEEPRRVLFRSCGVEVLRSPFQSSVAQVVKDASPYFDLVYLTENANILFAPESLRGLSPRSKIVLEIDRTGVGSAAKDNYPSLVDGQTFTGSAAIDAVLLRTAQGMTRLGQSHASSYKDRQGLWLIFDAEGSASKDARSWFARAILPLILKALPGVEMHAAYDNEEGMIAGVVMHKKCSVDTEFLRKLRLGIVPLRKSEAEASSIATCLSTGTPIIATKTAMGAPLGGVELTGADARDLARRVVESYRDEHVWQALAGAIRPQPTATPNTTDDGLVTLFQSLIRDFRLPGHDRVHDH